MVEQRKVGYVAMLGRPNSGKSTLLNGLCGKKVSIVSDVPQTTRRAVRAVADDGETRVIFVDTPGLNVERHDLSKYLQRQLKEALKEVDLVLYVYDLSRHFGPEEEAVLRILKHLEQPYLVVLNKMDLVKTGLDTRLAEIEMHFKRHGLSFSDFYPVSAKSGRNLVTLWQGIKEHLPTEEAVVAPVTTTEEDISFMVAELIREKFFQRLRDEIPHSLHVEVVEIRSQTPKVYIGARVYVERLAQKKIVIGQGGQLIKEAGTKARQELEALFNKPVYLDLQIEVDPDWSTRL